MSMVSRAPASPSSRPSRRSRFRASFGPDGGLLPMNSIAHRCLLIAARVRWAKAPRSARQSPYGSGTSTSAWIDSSIRSSSSSLEPTCQYRDIAPAPSSRAMRRMLIASGPSASATAIAVLTISARDSPRSRRGGGVPRSLCRCTCPAIRWSRASSRATRPGRSDERGYRKNGQGSASSPHSSPGPTRLPIPPSLAPPSLLARSSLVSPVGAGALWLTGAPPGPSNSLTACSFPPGPACRKPSPPATTERAPGQSLALPYIVLLWYIVLERTTYEQRGVIMGETPAIEAEGLVRNFGPATALAGLDLVVPPG